MRRREFALCGATAIVSCSKPPPAPLWPGSWPPDWDRILIEKAVAADGQRFDPKENMLTALVGAGYKYHTRLRDRRAHPTRDSLEYALYLLEEGSAPRVERALKIVDKVVALQVTDPASKWFGIWGWYLEEPPDQMDPADWNWADFNGATLLLIAYRHHQKLGPERQARVLAAIHNAALSIQRRNVAMDYTNIAILGSFVTVAAGELLQDAELSSYAHDRLLRLCQAIDVTGSFQEYNSPPYARVSITALTRIRMYVKDEESRRRAGLIEDRVWLELASHWDAARKQVAGPMSRCYDNDLGYPIWLEKSLGGKLGLADPQNRSGSGDAETAIHDYRCPPGLVQRFLTGAPQTEHLELFYFEDSKARSLPVQGTTWFGKNFSLGSANRSDFWVQRRPLLAYFGDDSRPARTVQLRVIKDGYDFSSALFFSVQSKGRLLGLVNFRNPGGNRHISLDPIRNGEFKCGRLFLELDFEGLVDGHRHDSDEHSLSLSSHYLESHFRVVAAQFGRYTPVLKSSFAAQSVTVTLDLKPLDGPNVIRWAEVPTAFAAFTFELCDAGSKPSAEPARHSVSGGIIQLHWGDLELTGSTRVGAVEAQSAAFRAAIAGKPVPLIPLSDSKLA